MANLGFGSRIDDEFWNLGLRSPVLDLGMKI